MFRNTKKDYFDKLPHAVVKSTETAPDYETFQFGELKFEMYWELGHSGTKAERKDFTKNEIPVYKRYTTSAFDETKSITARKSSFKNTIMITSVIADTYCVICSNAVNHHAVVIEARKMNERYGRSESIIVKYKHWGKLNTTKLDKGIRDFLRKFITKKNKERITKEQNKRKSPPKIPRRSKRLQGSDSDDIDNDAEMLTLTEKTKKRKTFFIMMYTIT